MLIVRLKQCEMALADGRLDEAFDRVRQPDIWGHRRGQEMVGELARALIARGRSHLASGQLVCAGQDCQKAEQLAGNLPEIAQLRAAVSHAISQERRANQRAEQLVAAVRQHADQGQLTIGERLLDDASVPEEKAQSLRRDLTARRATIESAMQKATALFEGGDWEAAAECLARLDRGLQGDPSVRELIGRINTSVIAQASEAIESGRLDLAAALLQRLQKLPSQCVEAEHLRRTVRQCREAFDCIGRGDAAGAEQIIRGLVSLWPQAKWLASAGRQLNQLRESSDELRASPLRLACVAPPSIPPPLPRPIPPVPRAENGTFADYVLHVDGVGSFRVLARPVITIGPVSSSTPVDVPLMADASLPVVTISRSDDDYFVQSRQPIAVNDKPVTSKLLAHGDRIAIGSRCRITFRRPSPASSSAVLDLSGTRLSRGDMRHIILMDRELILGPGPATHIRCDDLSAAAVFQHRGSRLVCRSPMPIQLDGQPVGTEAELLMGKHITIGTVGLVPAHRDRSG